jgi:CheY-like chemotaxis protein
VKILVVDDERAIRFSLAELLESDGHEVREAEHAPAVLAALPAPPAAGRRLS